MAATFDPTKPYNDLPLLPPPSAALCHQRVLTACVRAARRLGELRGALLSSPLPGVLPHMLTLVEAQASSALEGEHTSLSDLLACSEDPTHCRIPEAASAWRVAYMLRNGASFLHNMPTSGRLAKAACSTIMARDMAVRRLPGTHLGSAQGKVVYTPPDSEARLLDLLSDWEHFVHDPDDGIDPLVKLAVAHYQFEAIHPFDDGNGRTGRVMAMYQLLEQNLLDEPVLCLSRWFWRRQFDYYRLLLAVTEHGGWVDWIEFVLQGVEAESVWSIQRVEKLTEAYAQTVKVVAGCCAPKHRPDLARHLFLKPRMQRADLCEALGTYPWSASCILRALENAGVMRRARVGAQWYFSNVKFLAVLED